VTAFDVLDRYGAGPLTRLVVALAVFLLLHLVRWPLTVAVRVLEVAMRRVDAYATRQANPLITVRRDPRHAHAP
jgi:cytochrome c-type biogenesis protein CcmH/NrfG